MCWLQSGLWYDKWKGKLDILPDNQLKGMFMADKESSNKINFCITKARKHSDASWKKDGLSIAWVRMKNSPSCQIFDDDVWGENKDSNS